jgi:hypothetical protein
VEAKATTNSHQPTPWLRQAKNDADGGLHCVVAKVHRRPLDQAVVYMPASALRWWLTAETVDDETVRFMSLAAWADLIDLHAKAG